MKPLSLVLLIYFSLKPTHMTYQVALMVVAVAL
jgi:hypothetical protein